MQKLLSDADAGSEDASSSSESSSTNSEERLEQEEEMMDALEEEVCRDKTSRDSRSAVAAACFVIATSQKVRFRVAPTAWVSLRPPITGRALLLLT
eukprot:scaffold121671_cov18-Tisochrysis_lutea.AAC.1